MTRGRWLLLVAVSLLLSLSLPLLFGGRDSLQRLAAIPVWGLPLLLGMILVGWCLNAQRVRILTGANGLRLGFGEALGAVVSAEFAGSATPALAGAPATYVYLFTRKGLAAGEAMAVVALDQVADLVFFATVLPLMLLIEILLPGTAYPEVAALVLLLPLTGVVVLVALPRHYRPVAIAIGRLLPHVPGLRRVRWRLARWLIQFRHSVGLMIGLGPIRLLTVYLLCAGHWLLRYSTLPLILLMLGEEMSWPYLFLAQGLMLAAGYLTLLPGGSGGVELGFGALIGPYTDAQTVAAAALLWRFCTFYWYLIAGAPVFMLTTGRRLGALIAGGLGTVNRRP